MRASGPHNTHSSLTNFVCGEQREVTVWLKKAHPKLLQAQLLTAVVTPERERDTAAPGDSSGHAFNPIAGTKSCLFYLFFFFNRWASNEKRANPDDRTAAGCRAMEAHYVWLWLCTVSVYQRKKRNYFVFYNKPHHNSVTTETTLRHVGQQQPLLLLPLSTLPFNWSPTT